MNKLKNRNMDGTLVTLSQACGETNLGETTIRKLAKESGAVRKIGKCYRIKLPTLLEYIDNMFSE